MTSDSGTTTATEAGPKATHFGGRDLVLAWCFPRASAPLVDLRLDGGARDLTVGRDAGCAVLLDGSDVSRRHAVLRKPALEHEKTGVITIADLGSHNGVYVNGSRVMEASLSLGDVVRIGGWVGVVTSTPGEVVEIAPGFWGGARLQAALAPLKKVAPTDLPVILLGETGTGKEIVARALHVWSGRSGPFVAINCAALPEALAEGELFGYRRGAFTGADRANPGVFRSAEGGTLLLDEVSDLPLAIQAKVLRVLEQHEVQPLGEARPLPIDVRIVAAGQQPFDELVRAQRFRTDLLARLDGLSVFLPPLRERREDVLTLFSRLLESVGHGRVPAFERDLAEWLCIHDWPFNVRELVFLVRRLVALHGSEATLRAAHLPARLLEADSSIAPAGRSARPGAPAPLAGGTGASGAPVPVQLPALMVALRASGGNVARAAAILGISRQRAYRLMEGQAVDLDSLRGVDEKPLGSHDDS